MQAAPALPAGNQLSTPTPSYPGHSPGESQDPMKQSEAATGAPCFHTMLVDTAVALGNNPTLIL